MLGYTILTIDGSFLMYEGKREIIDNILGSDNAKIKEQLKQAGKQYRIGRGRKEFNLVVDELIDKGKSRNPIRYEVLAQIYRFNLNLVYKDEIYFSPVKNMPDDIIQIYQWLNDWRDYWTGNTTKTMRYSNYLNTSYLNRSEIYKLLKYCIKINNDEITSENESLAELKKLFPIFERVYKNGNEIYIINGGYVPKRLKPSSW